MVLKNVLAAIIGTTLLAWSGPAVADEYRPGEFLGLDLSKAVLSPKPLGPAQQFVPVQLEAKTDRGNEPAPARAEAKVELRVEPRIVVHKTRLARACAPGEAGRACARGEAARRGSNQAGAATRQSAGRASLRYADSGLAVQVRRHLQLEAVGK
jgi:hypothetical protein